MIPLQDENGRYRIHGKNFYLIYQVVEKSTYTSNSSVTLKSLMPICCKRHAIDVDDVDGNKYVLPYYTVFVFRKEIPIILFYLAHGIDFTLSYLNVNNVVKFIDVLPDDRDPDSLYFSLSSKCYIQVDKGLFQEHPYIQSIVGGFANVCTTRVSLQSLDTPDEWIKKIANPPSLEKGRSVLKYFNRLMDLTTQKVLKIPEYYKDDVYGILKWISNYCPHKTPLIAGKLYANQQSRYRFND